MKHRQALLQKIQLPQARRTLAAAAVLATGLLGVGLPAASAHTGVLDTSGVCQDDGTRLVTYTGTTTNVPSQGSGHVATLTVGEILPTGSAVSPGSQTVTGNTSFTFTQSIPGDATSAQATAFLAWGDGAESDPIGRASFPTDCTPPVVVPEEPEPVVEVTHSDDKDCDSREVTTTTVTTTTGWVLEDNTWVKDEPVVTETVETRPTTPEECPVVEPPVVEPPVVEPPVVEPPVVEPPVVEPPVVEPPVDDNQVIVLGVEAAVNPLPMGADAGQADTSGQMAAAGVVGSAAYLALGAALVLRRRRAEV